MTGLVRPTRRRCHSRSAAPTLVAALQVGIATPLGDDWLDD